MTYASFEDVQNRFHRELEEGFETLILTRLGDAEGKLRVRIPDLDARILENPAYGEIVVRVTADAVLRLIKNPEGYVQETDGNYTYMLSQRLAEGALTISPDEWRDLGVTRSVGVMHVIPVLPGEEGIDESIGSW